MKCGAVLEAALTRTRLWRPARTAYQRTLNRPYWAERQARKRMLSPFVSRGDLVFDVGANKGLFTETLLELGAKVVAVEPNPRLAVMVRARFRVPVVQAALGAEPGTADLLLGQHPGHSTLSQEWAEHVEDRWAGSVTVQVRTLDDLIRQYGKPRFVKLDVECYEPQVLAGLTEPLDAVSFEYVRDYQQPALASIRRLERLGRYEYAIEHPPYTPGPWLEADQVKGALDRLPAGARQYGDIIARLRV